MSITRPDALPPPSIPRRRGEGKNRKERRSESLGKIPLKRKESALNSRTCVAAAFTLGRRKTMSEFCVLCLPILQSSARGGKESFLCLSLDPPPLPPVLLRPSPFPQCWFHTFEIHRCFLFTRVSWEHISSDLRSSLLVATVDSLFHEAFHPWTPSSFVPVLLSSLRFRHTYIGLGAARASFALRFFASAPLLTSQSPSPWNPPPLPIAQKT